MLVPIYRLVDRLRHPRSRAEEVYRVRSQLAASPGASRVSAEEVALAHSLRADKERLSASLAEVESCGACANGHPLPHGQWRGGHCCGARTEQLFTDDEIAVLRLSGTRPLDLIPPQSEHAGCAFRGPTGCTIAAADRPSICVRYVCPELAHELAERGILREVDLLAATIAETFARLVALREERRRLAEPDPFDLDGMG